MHTAPQPRNAGAEPPISNVVLAPAPVPRKSAIDRAGAFLQEVSAGRTVSDAEVKQHAMDCAWLMERAYARFEELHNPADRDEAVLWMHRKDEALKSLSAAFKAAREAQIQQAIGQDYFRDTALASRGGVT